jgi:hypothetical protein
MFNPKVGFNALSSIFKDREVASEIDSELQFHLETMVEEYIASGVPADQAREIALKRFGDINQGQLYLPGDSCDGSQSLATGFKSSF